MNFTSWRTVVLRMPQTNLLNLAAFMATVLFKPSHSRISEIKSDKFKIPSFPNWRQSASRLYNVEANPKSTVFFPCEIFPRERDIESERYVMSEDNVEYIQDDQYDVTFLPAIIGANTNGEGRFLNALINDPALRNLSQFAGFNFGDDRKELVKIEGTHLRLLGKLFGFEPTVGLSFGLPLGSSPAVEGSGLPIGHHSQGIPFGPIEIHPLLAFEFTDNQNRTKLFRPAANLHITPSRQTLDRVKGVFHKENNNEHVGGSMNQNYGWSTQPQQSNLHAYQPNYQLSNQQNNSGAQGQNYGQTDQNYQQNKLQNQKEVFPIYHPINQQSNQYTFEDGNFQGNIPGIQQVFNQDNKQSYQQGNLINNEQNYTDWTHPSAQFGNQTNFSLYPQSYQQSNKQNYQQVAQHNYEHINQQDYQQVNNPNYWHENQLNQQGIDQHFKVWNQPNYQNQKNESNQNFTQGVQQDYHPKERKEKEPPLVQNLVHQTIIINIHGFDPSKCLTPPSLVGQNEKYRGQNVQMGQIDSSYSSLRTCDKVADWVYKQNENKIRSRKILFPNV